jgi:hypothetical protein
MRLGITTKRLAAMAMVTGAMFIGLTNISHAQTRTNLNERTVEPEREPNDRDGVWTLHFRFKEPRILIADIPGRGRRVVWYMWYQVYNLTSEPRQFVPEFELVTLDRNTAHLDEVLPSVQEQISKIEDPSGRLGIKNSVTIGKDVIEVTKKESFPKSTTGVAIWSDVYDRAPNTNRFSIFVTGLSDGFTKDDRGVIRRKTLQLNFKRAGDGRVTDTSDIKLDEAVPTKWIYRSAGLPAAVEGKKDTEPKKEAEPKKVDAKDQ